MKTRNQKKLNLKKCLFWINLSFFLVACGNQDNIDKWANDINSQMKEKHTAHVRPPKQEPGSYQSNFTFKAPSQIPPFSPEKLKLSDFPGARDGTSALERYSLNELKYVGYLHSSSGKTVKGFVKADNHVYTVLKGSPIGKNHGRVENIYPNELLIKEFFENSEGRWEARTVKIDLNHQGVSDVLTENNNTEGHASPEIDAEGNQENR